MINNKNIEKVILEDKTIYLVKTAHISAQSVEDVKEAISQLQPDMIAIELDQERFESMTQQKKMARNRYLTCYQRKEGRILTGKYDTLIFSKKNGKEFG